MHIFTFGEQSDMNESDNRSKNNPTEREKIRPLGIIYDLIIFAVLFCLFFIVFPDRTTASKTINGNGQIIQAALFIVCVFGARLIFKVYRQVLRYGNAGAYARIVASDILGGAVYAVINYFPRVRARRRGVCAGEHDGMYSGPSFIPLHIPYRPGRQLDRTYLPDAASPARVRRRQIRRKRRDNDARSVARK